MIRLFFVFFKIGLFTVGGGYAMIPMIQQEISKLFTISVTELVEFIAVSESIPGPFAVNIATFIGIKTYGIWGGIVATLGIVLPSAIIILLIASNYNKFKNSRIFAHIMYGMRPAALALIFTSLLTLSIDFLSSGDVVGEHYIVNGLLLLTLVLPVFRFKIKPITVIGVSAFLGIVVGYLTN